MRLAVGALAVVLVGLALFEVTMQPSDAERLELGAIFALMAALMMAVAVILPPFARTNGSIRVTVAVLSSASFFVVTVGLVAVAGRMFFSEHDLALLLVVLGFGVVAALGFAIAIGRPLTSDLEQIASAADRVAEGDLAIRSGVTRHDEVGRLSVAIDGMIDRLSTAEAGRQADSDARRSFFAAVGHDLRTPLASLRAAVEAMQDGVASDPARYLDSMERDVGVLSSLVEDLFLLARIESGGMDLEHGVIDLTELADEAVDVMTPLAAERGISLRLQAEQRVLARGGAEAVSRVFRNLVDNAIRHGPPGSEVVIEVTGSLYPKVRVVDAGPGFSPDFVERAFDRFTRDDPARGRDSGGSGLGLAIAHGFITALDGEIWAEPGPGGKVGFQLPW